MQNLLNMNFKIEYLSRLIASNLMNTPIISKILYLLEGVAFYEFLKTSAFYLSPLILTCFFIFFNYSFYSQLLMLKLNYSPTIRSNIE